MKEYKMKASIFTVDEIEEFCNEWGWSHVKEFIKQEDWIDEHEPPYIWGQEGIGQFKGIDGNKYMTWNTFRSQWVGDVKNDPSNKLKFKACLKSIAGDWYGKNKDTYYFYDVGLFGGGPYDCNWPKEYDKTYEPNQSALDDHGKPHYNVVLFHMGVVDGKMWGAKKVI